MYLPVESSFVTSQTLLACLFWGVCLVWFGLVWFGLVWLISMSHPPSHGTGFYLTLQRTRLNVGRTRGSILQRELNTLAAKPHW